MIGECGDGSRAVALIRKQSPDLVFLDVQMPDIDGFGVLEAIEGTAMRVVVFVTAYHQYALRAFEGQALDYLLKPFGAERFKKAVQRARQHVLSDSAKSEVGHRVLALLEEFRSERRRPDRWLIRSTGRVSFLKVQEIDWIKGEGNYARIHAGSTTHLLRESLKELEGRLDPAQFIRIHRSVIVNSDRIRDLRPLFHGDYQVTLIDGTELTTTRNPANRLKKLLEDAI